MSFENDLPPEILALQPNRFYGSVPNSMAKLYKPYAVNNHLAIEKGGNALSMAVDLRGMDWMNNGYIYLNTTIDCYLFVQITVSPVTQSGATTICGATLYIGEESQPNIGVAAYWGTNIWAMSAFSRGILTAWIPPGSYYGIQGQYSGKVDLVVRYWLPDPGEAPPLQ